MKIAVIGASGEVGSSIFREFMQQGHEVVGVSRRAPMAHHRSLLSLEQCHALLNDNHFDLLVDAAGRGDHRADFQGGTPIASALAPSAERTGTPVVVLSTIRVMEGYSGTSTEDEFPRPVSDYAVANAHRERSWCVSDQARILRMVNFLSTPQDKNSPQSSVLPWSLVKEALESGQMTVRSAPSSQKQFISAADLVRAILLIAVSTDAPVRCWTVPGFTMTLEEMASAVKAAISRLDLAQPSVTFGSEFPPRPHLEPGWLANNGWLSELAFSNIVDLLESWIRVTYRV